MRILPYVIGTIALAFAAILAFPLLPTEMTDPPGGGQASSARSVASNATGLPLSVPPGFSMEILARVPGARAIAQDSSGDLWISQTQQGTVTRIFQRPELRGTMGVEFTGLRRPHGIAFDFQTQDLFIADEATITRYGLSARHAETPPQVIYRFPPSGRHFTRTLGFGPDDRLYVSIGSTCDVCEEKDPRNGAILSMKPDGTDVRTVATGLRNSVFFTWSQVDGRMVATEMGRDHLGDDLPPDEINIITDGAHYGWPFCYGKQIRDVSFNLQKTFDCAATEPSTIDLPAHGAPLGLAFVPEEGWPEEYWYDLLVALHGSWNRTEKTGYSVIRVPLDARGNSEGPIVEFVSGWLENGSVLGRPVDILLRPGGTMYVTDDKAGLVYLLQYQQP